MNSPFAHHEFYHYGEIWPAHPKHGGVPLYFTQSGFAVPAPATGWCYPTEVIDLVDNDGDSLTHTPVNPVAKTKSSKVRRRKRLVKPVDDDSLVRTVHPCVMESEERSLLRISDMSDDVLEDFDEELKQIFDSDSSDDPLEGFDEYLKEMLDSETSTSVVAQHDEDRHFNAISGDSLMVWDGGSLSFLDSFKDNEVPNEFSDDDIPAIGDHMVIVTAPEGFVRDGLDKSKSPMDVSSHHDDDEDDHVVILQDNHTCPIAPPLVVDEQKCKTSCRFLDRPSHMVSWDDETPSISVQPDDEAFAVQEDEFVFNISLMPLMFDKGLVVPWDNTSDSSFATIEDAIAAPAPKNVSFIPCSEW